MSTATSTRRTWDTLEYQQIASASYANGQLIVAFGDGAQVSVAVEDLLLTNAPQPDWPAARAEEFHISVPALIGNVEIPWDVIRRRTDPEFRAHWAEMAAQVARSVGTRIRRLREDRGLSAAELARRAGVSVATVERLEAGRLRGDLAVTDRILTAMGHTPDALIVEPVPPPAE